MNMLSGLAFDEAAFERLSHFLFCRRWSIFRASTDSGGFALPRTPCDYAFRHRWPILWLWRCGEL